MTCATSLQAGGKYAPRQQNDEQIATYEIFFKYDLRNGEKDENGKIRNRLYITWLDASGAQLDRYVIDEADEKYKRKIPDNPSTKLKISLVVRKNERWVLLEVYSKEHRNSPTFTAERCLWSGLEKELLEDFDAGELVRLNGTDEYGGKWWPGEARPANLIVFAVGDPWIFLLDCADGAIYALLLGDEELCSRCVAGDFERFFRALGSIDITRLSKKAVPCAEKIAKFVQAGDDKALEFWRETAEI